MKPFTFVFFFVAMFGVPLFASPSVELISPCIACHKPDRPGVLEAPSFQEMGEYADARFLDAVQNGKGRMPPVGDYFVEQVLAIASFIRSEFQSTGSSGVEPIRNAFPGHHLIHIPAAGSLEPGSLNFIIHHRFGNAKDGYGDFLGLDNGAAMKLGVQYAPFPGAVFGLARTSEEKAYELTAGYTFMEQSEGSPFTLTLFSSMIQATQETTVNLGSYTDRITVTGDAPMDTYLNDTFNRREYRLSDSDRRSYMLAVLASLRMLDRFSLQVSPIFVHKNFVKPELSNDRIGLDLAFGVRVWNGVHLSLETIQAGKRDYQGDRYADLDEKSYEDNWMDLETLDASEINRNYLSNPNRILYAYARNVYYDRPVSYYKVPLSLSLDFETGTHVFQIVLSNSQHLSYARTLRGADYSYEENDIVLGFNINRRFQI